MLWVLSAVLAATMVLFPQRSYGQQAAEKGGTGDARLTVKVTDQTGAVIPGANLQLTGAGVDRSATADAEGNASFSGLAAGVYTLSASSAGFKVFQAKELSLAAGDTTPVEAVLEPAGDIVKETVQAEHLDQVETEKAEVSGTITQKEVVKIGLNGRNFTQLIALAPGVSNQTSQDEAKVGVVGSVKYSVNGGRVEYNTFDVDGSDVLNAGLNGAESTLIVYPSLDAIQEVKVLTSSYGAQYGRTASGTVIVTTKSGGDKYHGNAYEFIRNEIFNARNYFDQTSSAPLYRRHDLGATFGGPLFIPGVFNTKKDKTFFFFSEELRLEKTPAQYNQAVPTVAERSGDFSDVCPDVQPGGATFTRAQFPDCPGTAVGGGVFRALPNNSILAVNGSLDRNAQAVLASGIIPLPTSTTGCNSSISDLIPHCYVASISPSTYWREELFRIDHNFSDKLRATVRYIHDSWNATLNAPLYGFVQNSFPTLQQRVYGPGTSAVARLSYSITPSILNEVSFSYTNAHIQFFGQSGPGAQYNRPSALDAPCAPNSNPNAPLDCPIGALFQNGFGGKLPGIVIAGTNAAYGGSGFAVDSAYAPWDHTNPTYTIGESVSWATRKHTLQLGSQFILYQRNQDNSAIGAATGDVQGLLTFTNQNNLNTTGNAFADFLSSTTGIRSYQQDSAQARYRQRYQIAEPYIQDDWKITRRLTLNLGLRVSLFGTYHELNKLAYNFVPSAFSQSLASQVSFNPVTGQLLDANSGTPVPLDVNNLDPRLLNGIVRCGFNGLPDSCMDGHLVNWAPRFGFAWDPRGDGKMSIRGGYGIFYEHGTGSESNTGSLEASSPVVLTLTQNFPTSWACIGGGSPLTQAAQDCGRPGAYAPSFTSIPRKTVWPYSQQWSLGVQREIMRSLTAGFAYVGSKGTHLTAERQINQLSPLPDKLNPFSPNEPLIPATQQANGDCALQQGFFLLTNGTRVGAGDPAYASLLAACYGADRSIPSNPDQLRPFRGINRIYSLENIATSSYNAFQATLRRTAAPLTLGISYSYSHSIDDSSDRSDATFVNSADIRTNRASSNFDQRHLLSVSYIWQIPYWRNFGRVYRRWEGEPEPDEPEHPRSGPSLSERLLSHWEASGVTVYQKGTPFSVINGASFTGVGVLDNAGVANGAGIGSYPDRAVGPVPSPAASSNAGSLGPLLNNPNLFVAPRGLTFGNAGRNVLNNPGRLNFDVALARHFRVSERADLEFRAEVFNLFNHTQFRVFDPALGNTAHNTINCYGPGAYSAFDSSGNPVISSGPNLSGPNFSAGGGSAQVTSYANGVPVTSTATTNCLSGSSFLRPVNAHRPRTMQFGLKISF